MACRPVSAGRLARGEPSGEPRTFFRCQGLAGGHRARAFSRPRGRKTMSTFGGLDDETLGQLRRTLEGITRIDPELISRMTGSQRALQQLAESYQAPLRRALEAHEAQRRAQIEQLTRSFANFDATASVREAIQRLTVP